MATIIRSERASEAAQKARALLLHYFQHVGLKGGPDVSVELGEVIEYTIEAAVEQAKTEIFVVAVPVDVTLAERDLEEAADRCGQAHARVMWLEDERSREKPAAIKRIMTAGQASSASAAEKLVELDEAYVAIRTEQRENEIERWAALADFEKAKARVRRAGGES